MTDKGGDSPQFEASWVAPSSESSSSSHSTGYSVCYFWYIYIYIYYIYLFIEIWATDISYLSSFWKWASGRTFYPLPRVPVTVVERKGREVEVPPSQCSDCNKVWEESSILSSTDWSKIEEMVCGRCSALVFAVI